MKIPEGFKIEATEWRRHLHTMPELEFDTFETAAFVAEKLRAFGCDQVETGIGRSGVVGVIEGKPGNRVIGLRADMDALPMTETTGLPYASKVPGKMHACGHDGHTAILLATARLLCASRDFSGKVVVIFQPAEETGGGAGVMIKDGLFTRFPVDEIYGMHNTPGIPVGSFAIRSGVFAAASDVFDITVTGRAAHAANPDHGIDPLIPATQIINAAQTIVSRKICPINPLVVSVTTISTDTDAYNILPGVIRMKGTVRALDAATRDQAEKQLKHLVPAIAAAHSATGEIDYRRNYPILRNDPEMTEHAARAAETVGPVDREISPDMGTEDFAFFSEAVPGAYICFGNGDTAVCHHSDYDFNDAALPPTVTYLQRLVQDRLPG
ncbi:amidohydrolase [Rhodobacteraceae bacterium F11138]|nr:amidohydrolase [Rhodobacteraceae bacterium F11138]